MSENYDDDEDLEKLIFKGGLASGAVEPSEKFWNKAYENILERDARAGKKSAKRWRSAFFATGTVALLIGSYAFYVHNEVSEIRQQLTTIETTQKTIVQQNTSQTTLAVHKEKTTSGNDIITTNSANKIPNATVVNETKYNGTASANSFTNTIKAKQIGSHANASGFAYSVNPSHSNVGTAEASPASNTINENTENNPNPVASIQAGNSSIPTIQTSANPAAVAANSTQVPPPAPTPSVSSNTAAKSVAVNNTAAKTADLDSSNALYLDRKPIRFKDILAKTSISAFYAPGVTDDFLHDKNNDPTKSITAKDIKTHQDGDGTFATGLRLAYDLSDRWSLFTGCYYSLYSYNINPTVIYAQQQENGQVGYSITTSSGTVFIPYSAGTTHVGDSIKIRGSSSRGYLSIPVQAKYKLPVSSNLAFYVTGGFAVNIANYKETRINWENTAFQEGNVSVQDIYGLNMVQYSYNIGIGAQYLICRGLSVYAEPYLDGSFTSINNNTPVITYPYFFGAALGVTYHF